MTISHIVIGKQIRLRSFLEEFWQFGHPPTQNLHATVEEH